MNKKFLSAVYCGVLVPFVSSNCVLGMGVGTKTDVCGLKSEMWKTDKSFYKENLGKENENSWSLSASCVVTGGVVALFAAYFGLVFFLKYLVKNKLIRTENMLYELYLHFLGDQIDFATYDKDDVEKCTLPLERLKIFAGAKAKEEVGLSASLVGDFLRISKKANEVRQELISGNTFNLSKLYMANEFLCKSICELNFAIFIDSKFSVILQ